MTSSLKTLSFEPFCHLTTVGRVSGCPHEIEIWFSLIPEKNTLYMLAGNPDSDWVKNARRNPDVTVRIAGETLEGHARLIEDNDEDELARDLLVEKYETTPGSLSNWRGSALPVAVDLVG